MDGRESTEQFKRADAHFRAGQHEAALEILEALDRAHPDTRNILVPMAMCLERLGRYEEALDLSDRIVRRFGDARARDLRQRLRLPRALPQVGVDALLDDSGVAGAYAIPDLGPVTTVPVPVQSEDEPARWPVPVACGVCILLILGVLFLPLLGGGEGAVQRREDAMITGVMLGFFAGGFCIAVVSGTVAASLALGAIGKLPANTISGVLLEVGGTILLVSLVNGLISLLFSRVESLPLVFLATLGQFGVMLAIFKRSFGLGWGELVAFTLVYLILGLVLIVVPLVALAVALGVLGALAGGIPG